MHAEPSRRIAANDYGRGIGIFLVVLGHVLIGLDDHGILSESSTPHALGLSRAAIKWIYAFHMPLFFFLSGTLVERSVRKPFGEVLSSRLRTMAWPYIVWSLFQESLRELTGISQGSASDWWRILYRPMMQFWFLYVLFFLSLAYYGLRRMGVPRLAVLLIAAVLHAGHLSTEVPVMSWVYHEFCKHGLYLAAGAVTAEWLEHRTIPFAGSTTLRLLAAAVGYMLIADWVAYGWPLGPMLLAFVGIASSIALASVLAAHRTAKFLEKWGLLSLQIYVAHTIVSAATRSFLLRCGVHDPSAHVVLQTAAGIYGPIALYKICRRTGCDWVFSLRPTRVRGERPA
ncbi:MAG TPA: acyltransferase family protein [Planctomycetaceae bacterium]|jgi:fucose 4-O-acetylase-like acetyltransferase|nr:acyltransferase family protein [Planctomycetaceae bacterium]